MNPLTARHRREQLAVRAATVAALLQVWPTLDPERLDETFPGWATAVAAVTARNRGLSSAVAARYVRQFRAAGHVPGPTPAGAASTLPMPVLLSSLAVTGPVAIKKAMTRGVPLSKAVDSAFVLSSGAVSRHVLDAGRETVLSSLQADPHATAWQRVTSGRSCDFCDALAVEFPVGSGDFASHDHCACTVEPVYA